MYRYIALHTPLILSIPIIFHHILKLIPLYIHHNILYRIHYTYSICVYVYLYIYIYTISYMICMIPSSHGRKRCAFWASSAIPTWWSSWDSPRTAQSGSWSTKCSGAATSSIACRNVPPRMCRRSKGFGDFLESFFGFWDFRDFLVMFQDFFSDLGDFWRFWECWDGTWKMGKVRNG